MILTQVGSLALPRFSESGLPSPPLEIRRNVWLQVESGQVERIGPDEQAEPPDDIPGERLSVRGMLATPAFVDAHTHPVFADWREREFVARINGLSYQQIAAQGGGILNSADGLRKAPEARLVELTIERLNRFAALGVGTIEAKSGYGLTVESKLKALSVLKQAALNSPVEISPSLLGAHVVPREFKDNPAGYVDLVCNKMIPLAAAEGLAESVDVFLEEGAFDLAAARKIFEAARNAGLQRRIHADQFTSGGGAALAAEFGALSADHMDHTSDEGLKLLALSGVTIVLLPGAVFFLGRDRYAPARKMLELGCRIALATDFNPGSSPTQSLPLMMTLACVKMGLTPAEALWAATLGGAFALGRQKLVGTLIPGYQADICLWDIDNIDMLPYRYGDMRPAAVFKRGRLVYEAARVSQ